MVSLNSVAPINEDGVPTGWERTVETLEMDGSDFVPLEDAHYIEQAARLVNVEEEKFRKLSVSGSIPNMSALDKDSALNSTIPQKASYSPWEKVAGAVQPEKTANRFISNFAKTARAKRRQSINILRKLNKKENRGSFIISPTSWFRTYWDVFIAIAVLYFCWMIPILVSMSWWKIPSSLENLNIFLDWCFFLDILMNFRTGFIQYGVVIMEPKKIAWHYLYPWFIIDAIATFPAETFIKFFSSADTNTEQSTTARKTIKLLKYMKVPAIF